MLKGHFPALKCLPSDQNIQDTYCLIEALLTLYNICIDLSDEAQAIPVFDPSSCDEHQVSGQREDVNLPVDMGPEDDNEGCPD